MARIALCWELGAGNGHLAILAECVQPLIAQGHQICLIAHNINTIDGFDEFKNIDVYQAPVLSNSLNSYDIVNYSSILLSCGYDNSNKLGLLLKAWSALFDAVAVDFVIAEHSPTALLAAKVLELPHAMLGSSFMVPPFLEPMPTIKPWRNVANEHLVDADASLLHHLNPVLKRLNPRLPTFTSINDLFANTYKWVIGFPELDHYGVKRECYFKRNRTLFSNNKSTWKGTDGDKVFVYLYANSPHLIPLLSQLSSLKLSVLAVIPGVNDKIISEYQSNSMHIQSELVNVKEVVEKCNIIISHASYSTVTDFLLMGVPSLLLPSTVEQTMFAYQLGLAKLAFAGSPNADKLNIDEMLKAVKTVDKVWENAKIFAEKYENSEQIKNLSGALKAALV